MDSCRKWTLQKPTTPSTSDFSGMFCGSMDSWRYGCNGSNYVLLRLHSQSLCMDGPTGGGYSRKGASDKAICLHPCFSYKSLMPWLFARRGCVLGVISQVSRRRGPQRGYSCNTTWTTLLFLSRGLRLQLALFPA